MIVEVEFLGENPSPGSVPSGEVVLFLVSKRGEEREYFRTVNSAGLVTSADNSAARPLREDQWQPEVRGMTSWRTCATDWRPCSRPN